MAAQHLQRLPVARVARTPQHGSACRQHHRGSERLQGRDRGARHDARRLQGTHQRGQRVDRLRAEVHRLPGRGEGRQERGRQETREHLPAPRILLYAVPAGAFVARQHHARQDHGPGRERRYDDRHPQDGCFGDCACRPADRGRIEPAESVSVRVSRKPGNSFFCRGVAVASVLRL